MTDFQLVPEIEALQVQNDFSDFLEYIHSHRVKLTKAGNMGPKDCFEINAKLYHSKEVKHNKVQHPRYTVLWSFFHLGLAMQLLERQSEKSSDFLVVNEEALAYFESFNLTEKYFALLAALWQKGPIETLNIEANTNDPVEYLQDALEEVYEGKKEGKLRYHSVSLVKPIIDLLAIMGWWETKYTTTSGGFMRLDDVELSLLGTYFVGKLVTERPLLYWNEEARLQEVYKYQTDWFFKQVREGFNEKEAKKQLSKTKKEPFHTAFLPDFPKDTFLHDVSFFLKSRGADAKANFTFKVSLAGRLWRKVKLSGEHNFDDLHLIIQKAFEFGNDHMYAFYMSNSPYRGLAYNMPEGNSSPPYTSDVQLKSLNLQKGAQFTYLFDFGDEWVFSVKVEDIEATEDPIKKPAITETKGESPEQYGW